ncbi:MAG: hypothetical protein PV354_01505, partial [Bartonella sp.]|nr:hypothetical protein [Bartonella sp.]
KNGQDHSTIEIILPQYKGELKLLESIKLESIKDDDHEESMQEQAKPWEQSFQKPSEMPKTSFNDDMPF